MALGPEEAAQEAMDLELAAEKVSTGKRLTADIEHRAAATLEGFASLHAQLPTQDPIRLRRGPPTRPTLEGRSTWLLCGGGVFVKALHGSALRKMDEDLVDLREGSQKSQADLREAVRDYADLTTADEAMACLNAA